MAVSSASPLPLVPISSVQGLDEGAEIRVVGAVSDLRRYDTGTDAIVLVDLQDGFSIRVYCSCGVGDMPGEYTKIGDELAVIGTVMKSSGVPSLLTSPDHVRLLKTSEYVLTVNLLARHWGSFLGDSLTISGRITESPVTGEVRLCDESGDASVSLQSATMDLSSYLGMEVVVSGELGMSQSELALFISVDWVREQV